MNRIPAEADQKDYVSYSVLINGLEADKATSGVVCPHLWKNDLWGSLYPLQRSPL